jgi:hypothetical protein
VSQVCFFFLAVALFRLSRAASVAILPSALFVEQLGLIENLVPAHRDGANLLHSRSPHLGQELIGRNRDAPSE